MTTTTGFYWDERCFWHAGAHYAQLAAVGGLVQPMVSGGLPEAPETKRRLKNLMDVTGLSTELAMSRAPAATRADLLRIHPASYLDRFEAMSDAGGGELGLRTPFGPDGYDIAAQSAGLVMAAVASVLAGTHRNAYALSRPPGHHCLPDWPNGFCLLNNIAIAIEAAKARDPDLRVAVVDWDVHHGNGTEAIFYDRDDVLTISVHQDRCYPIDTGDVSAMGRGAGQGANMNLPLPPGCGHVAYLDVMQRLVIPRLAAFDPDLVIVACGFDASNYDPLARMMCSPETFRQMTKAIMDLTGGRMVAAHEGGYSEVYVPFCGHAMLEEMSGSAIRAPDPLAARNAGQQPDARGEAFHRGVVDDLVAHFRAAGQI
ncbi:class II histone deacetylase [Jannaschia sp. 2305UL9-9]|uniref:class II histone deacetylase n=1 Tax=Jannaschia sp. 2305UL9-9 TaxID=3121638 RepID=UPI0035282C4B